MSDLKSGGLKSQWQHTDGFYVFLLKERSNALKAWKSIMAQIPFLKAGQWKHVEGGATVLAAIPIVHPAKSSTSSGEGWPQTPRKRVTKLRTGWFLSSAPKIRPKVATVCFNS